MLAALALLASCKKPEPPPPPPPPPVELPKPGQEFSDPDLQRRYEATWNLLLDGFSPPATGSLLFVRLNDSSFAGGTVQHWTDEGLTLKDGRLVQEVRRQDVAEDMRSELFLREFLQKYAMMELMALPAAPPPATGGVARIRYSLTDYPEPRVGPGPRYRLAEDVAFNKGTTLVVLEERNGWLRVRPQKQPDATPFWINQFTTIPAPNAPPEDYSGVIAALLESGYLAGFAPMQNTALVPKRAWAGTDSAIREGISRVLAAQSSRLRGATVEWVEIKDVETGHRLARYSQAQGYRDQ